MNQIVENVFNSISSVANGAAAACSGIQNGFTTFETLQNQQQQQQTDMSRRNMTQMQQQTYQYRSPVYPWADASYSGYGFGTPVAVQNVGYPGITNPNYGKFGGCGFAQAPTQSAWGSPLGGNGTLGGGWRW